MAATDPTHSSAVTLPDLGRMGFASRISARAVAAGAVLALAALALLMTLGGAFGLWTMGPLDAEAVQNLKPGFYVWVAIAWIVSVFLGGLVASVVSRASSQRNGVLHGLITWATACLTGAVLLCMWFAAALAVNAASIDALGAMGRGMLAAFSVADALAVGAAILGGLLGARSEAKRGPAEPLSSRPGPTLAEVMGRAPEPHHR